MVPGQPQAHQAMLVETAHEGEGIYITGYTGGHGADVGHGVNHGGFIARYISPGKDPFAGGHSNNDSLCLG